MMIKNRKNNRLWRYNYTTAGMYFVTVCTSNRQCLFGGVADGKMELNEPGKMIQKTWQEIPLYYRGIQIDEFVIMPNHIHGIIVINHTDNLGTGPCACPNNTGPAQSYTGPAQSYTGPAQGPAPTEGLSLSDVVQRVKTLTTKKYIDGVKNNGWPSFDKRLWQRSFYDHVIRNDISLNRIREYIVNNPAQWAWDAENPAVNEKHNSVGK